MTVIAIDQYELGKFAQAIVLSTHVELAPSTVQLWHKPLATALTNGVSMSVAAAIVNFGVFDGQVFNATFRAEQVGLPVGCSYSARDLFEKKELGVFHDRFQAMVPATSILMLKLTVTKSE